MNIDMEQLLGLIEERMDADYVYFGPMRVKETQRTEQAIDEFLGEGVQWRPVYNAQYQRIFVGLRVKLPSHKGFDLVVTPFRSLPRDFPI